MTTFTAAAIQMRSGTEPRRNVAVLENMVREARRADLSRTSAPVISGVWT